MLFPTVEFAIFFAVVLTLNWVLVNRSLPWKLTMLAASYVFYAAWDARFVLLLVASSVVNHTAGRSLARIDDEGRRRLVVAGAVTANLGLLGWFKYYGFFVSSAVNALDALGLSAPLPLLEIVLPVGISFFTFQALSYVIDVYRRELAPAPLLDVAIFLAFFPQLVAGPIVRGKEFLPQLNAPRDPEHVDATRAFGLIFAGLFKKVVVANVLATHLVDSVFASPAQHSAPEILLGIYGYAVQIYADFSGYTDIAIGVALLMGFRFPQNFNAPYAAISVQDFWRRWHMTLSRWLRDYLYIPLGGSHGSRVGTYRNLLLTMLLGGLWHGAAWTFVLWGAFHGLWLAGERLVVARRGRTAIVASPTAWGRTAQRLVTFHVVCLGWVLFRAESLTSVGTILGRLVTAWGPAPALTPAVLALIALGIGVQYLPRDLGTRLEVGFSRLRPAAMTACLAGGLLVVDALGPQGIAPFIYFQF